MGAESRLQASTRVRPRTLPDSSDGHRSVLLAAVLAGVVAAWPAKKSRPGAARGPATPDRLIGSSASQTMRGLEGGESVSGYRGDDDVVGGRGGDAVYGGLGDDRVYGNQGNDYVEGDYGHDYINTGSGSDKVAAKDGYRDRIICGQGNRDKVYKDKRDTTRGCERTLDRKPSP